MILMNQLNLIFALSIFLMLILFLVGGRLLFNYKKNSGKETSNYNEASIYQMAFVGLVVLMIVLSVMGRIFKFE